MIKVKFANGIRRVETELYQWDYGQWLQIEGLDLPETFEMHFQNGSGDPFMMEGTVENGVGTVLIPDFCTQRAYGSFRGWIYLEDENSGTTIATVVFKLTRRERPSHTPPISTVTEIKGYADYVEENAAIISQAQQASSAASAAAQAANEAAQAANAAAQSVYTKDQVEALLHSEIAAVYEITPELVIWDAMNRHMEDYLEEADYSSDADYENTLITSYAPSGSNAEYCEPVGKAITLPEGELYINGCKKTVSAGLQTFFNLIPNVNTPFNVVANGKIVKTGLLHPSGQVRVIKCPAAHNARDLGGWKTYNSAGVETGTVRYGKLFRGSEVSASDADVLVNQCGVRWELDLRGTELAEQSGSVLGNVGYSKPEYGSAYMWYKAALYQSNSAAVKEALECVLDAVTNGSPIYYHCSEGIDRAGTLSTLIEGLLGCSLSDIDKDYELSNFYSTTATESSLRARNEDEWKNFISDIKALTGSSIQEKLGRWMIETLGISASRVNAFRNCVIDGAAEQFTHITNLLTNCASSNAQALFLGSGEYSATITPSTGYELDNVNAQVLLNGTDITSQVYSQGVISIPSSMLTGGELIINVQGTASAPAYTNVFDYSTAYINYRFKSDNTLYAQNGYFVTDYIACDLSGATANNSVLIRFKNCTLASNAKAVYYNSNKTALTSYMKAYLDVQTDENGDAYVKAGWGETIQNDASTNAPSGSIADIRFVRFALQKQSSALTSVNDLQDVIITLNEAIS